MQRSTVRFKSSLSVHNKFIKTVAFAHLSL